MNPDYIIIGAGSSGCVLANRLGGPDGGQVLLLEAGGNSRGILHRMPLAATTLWADQRKTWNLWSEPEQGLNGRRIPVPRGRALGGSSAINGTVYNRGSPHDYDQWRDMGLVGWDYQSLLPYFRRIENHWRGADALHGAGGEVPVTPLRSRSPFTPAFFAAARQMGLPLTDDPVGEQAEGIGLSDLNVDARGRRVSAADAFLWPIRRRKSLIIERGAQVLKIHIEHGRAVGVDYLLGKQVRHVRAQREVILAGGAIASPQLLLLSGIGPSDELRRVGVTPVHHLPGVGRNFNDQPGASFEFSAKQPLTFVHHLRADRFAVALAQWALGFGGPAAGPPMIGMGALRTLPESKSPDLRMLLAAGTRDAKVWWPGVTQPASHTLLMNFAVAHPESRGSITLASDDPLAPPRIRFNLLTVSSDMDKLKSYYGLLNDLIRQPAFASIAGEITRPGHLIQSDQELDEYLRSTASTTSHPMGSCTMGVTDEAVVDSQCRVRGIEALRVVDASVFPTQISGNPHATVMMLGDRVSDFILGRPPAVDSYVNS